MAPMGFPQPGPAPGPWPQPNGAWASAMSQSSEQRQQLENQENKDLAAPTTKQEVEYIRMKRRLEQNRIQ